MAAAKKKTRPTATLDTETARKIWLAGVGAYGRAFDNAREQIGKLNDDAGSYFEDLVARGEKIENDAYGHLKSNERLNKVAKRATNLTERAEHAAEQQREFVEARMATLRETLEMPLGVLTLGRKIRSLSAQLDEVAEDVAEIKATIKPAKKTTAKRVPKATAKRTTKRAAKKTVKKTAKKTARKSR